MGDCRRLAESGNCPPRNRAVRDIVGAGNIANRLAGIAATEGFLDLTRCQLRQSTHLYPQLRLLHSVAPDMPKQRLTERFRSRAEGLVNSMRQIGIPDELALLAQRHDRDPDEASLGQIALHRP